MLYKRELIDSFETIGYSLGILLSIVIGPKWSFYSCIWILMFLGQVLYKCCIWVELPVQRGLCPIFVRNVGSPDIREYSSG